MTFATVLLVLSIIFNSALAFLVYSQNKKSSVNKSFSILTLGLVGWSISIFLTVQTSDTFFGKLAFAFGSIIPASYLHFALLFPQTKAKPKVLLIYLPAMIFALMSFIDNLMFEGIEIVHGGIQTERGFIYPIFTIYVITYIVLLSTILIRNFIRSKGLPKTQLGYLLLGLLLTTLSVISTNLLLPIFGFYQFNGIGPASALFFSAFTTYAIVKHRLMDIRLVVARTIAYSLLLLIITGSYALSMLAFSSYFFQGSLQGNQLFFSTILTIIVAFTFQPLRRTLEHATDKIFFKGMYDSHQLLAKMSHIMATTLLVDVLTKEVLHELTKQMRISRGAFILVNKGEVILVETEGYDKPPGFTQRQIFALEAAGKTLVFEEMGDGTLKDTLRKMDITISIPLKTSEKEIGLLLLGEKLSGEIYSDQDIKVLEILAPEVSVAIQNTLSYEEIRKFNVTLKIEVERATRKLRDANERLKEMDRLKDEFVSIASHELRTPMTAIKSYLWLILHKSVKLDEKIQRYLDRAYTSSDRMIALINDLLNVSRIESGRIQLEPKPTKLNDIVEETLAEIMPKASEKSLQLTFVKPKGDPFVMVDPQRFPEIITNFVGNSIKFTPPNGKITVAARVIKDKVQVDVTDTGVGISKEDQSKLFQKFGRLDNSYKAIATNGGSGLGLYITKNLIELQGGKVWVDSEVDKGATFSFTVPLAKESEIKKAHREEDKPLEGVYVNEKAITTKK
jgi:signal transduction histidine kinase